MPITSKLLNAANFNSSDFTISGNSLSLDTTVLDTDYVEDTHASSNLNLGTVATGSFADVDATNAAITFTVNRTGLYRVEFDFSHYIALNSTVNAECNQLFRLTDGSTLSPTIQSIWNMNAGDTPEIANQLCVCHVYDYSTTGAKTVRLQERTLTATNVAANLILSANTNGEVLRMRAYRISI